MKQLGKRLIDDYKEVLRISSKNVNLKKTDTDGAWWFVEYEQTFAGIPVYGSEVGFTIDPQGNIVSAGAFVFPNISVRTRVSVSSVQALSKAKKEFGNESATLDNEPELFVLPIEQEMQYRYYLTWKIRLSSLRPLRDSVYFVSTDDGSVIKSFSNILHDVIYGTVTGNYYPQRSSDPPLRVAYPTTAIRMYNLLGQTIGQTNADQNGNYSITYSVAYATYYLDFPLQSNWIQLRDANGNLIRHTFAFTPAASIRHDYDWPAGDPANVWYHGNRIHDFFRGAPFHYNGMDYQMKATVGLGADVNAAADGTDISFGSQAGQLWARSSDVVYHEYTHNTIYRIYGGWIGNPGQYYTQASAMDEGLSDYFACTINNDPILGEDVGVSRNLDNNTLTWTHWQGAHWNGQVIGGAVWDFRETAGPTVANNLAFKALQVVPRARDFSHYLYNMMIADNGTYNAAYRSQLRTAFAAHGITTTEPPWPGPTNLTYTGQSRQSPTLQWQYFAPADFGFSYFRVYRRADGEPFQVITTTTTTSYTDFDVVIGSFGIQTIFDYYVTAVNQTNVESAASNNVSVNGEWMSKQILNIAGSILPLPEAFALSQNHPNPFNPETQITFALPEASTVRLSIFDVLGREVAVLEDRILPAGYRTVRWNGRNSNGESVGSGVYFYRITATGKSGKTFTQTISMALMK